MVSSKFHTCVLFVCTVSIAQLSLCREAVEVMPDTNSGTKKYSEKEIKSRHLITRKMINHIRGTQTSKREKAEAIRALGWMQSLEAIPILIENLEFEADLPLAITNLGEVSPQNRFPAIGALIAFGESSMDALCVAAVNFNRSEQFRNHAIFALFLADPKVDRKAAKSSLHLNAEEFNRKSLRLRELSKFLPDAATKLVTPLDEVKVATIELADGEKKLARILEFLDIVRGDSIPKPAAIKVVAAIKELAQLQAIEATPILADKLDFAAEDKSYPAIAALVHIGEPALPAIADAISSRGRNELFRNNGLQAILQILKTPEAVDKALLGFAEEGKKKAQRLRDLADLLPKTN